MKSGDEEHISHGKWLATKSESQLLKMGFSAEPSWHYFLSYNEFQHYGLFKKKKKKHDNFLKLKVNLLHLQWNLSFFRKKIKGEQHNKFIMWGGCDAVFRKPLCWASMEVFTFFSEDIYITRALQFLCWQNETSEILMCIRRLKDWVITPSELLRVCASRQLPVYPNLPRRMHILTDC